MSQRIESTRPPSVGEIILIVILLGFAVGWFVFMAHSLEPAFNQDVEGSVAFFWLAVWFGPPVAACIKVAEIINERKTVVYEDNDPPQTD